MDKVQNYNQDLTHIIGLLVEAMQLSHTYVSPQSDEGTFLSDKEIKDLEKKSKTIIKEAMSRLSILDLQKSSECSFCIFSKPPKDM